MTKDDFRHGIKFFSFLKASRAVLRSNWPPILWDWDSLSGDKSVRYVKVTINLHPVRSSRMLEVTPPHPSSYMVSTAAAPLYF